MLCLHFCAFRTPGHGVPLREGLCTGERNELLRKLGASLLLLGIATLLLTLAYQAKAPIRVLVGERGADSFVEGFSFREDAPFGLFRWTGQRARTSRWWSRASIRRKLPYWRS